MGQGQSDEYNCDDGHLEDVADSEINAKEPSKQQQQQQRQQQQQQNDGANKLTTTAKGNNNQVFKFFSTSLATTKNTWGKRQDGTGNNEHEEHVRKLSNVSHRNIQLLSLRPRSEKDAYADDLRTRRRSSLINLILGAPSSGPKFSDDLCSLNSHMSELCNFGIEFFPDANQIHLAKTGAAASICSSLWLTGDTESGPNPVTGTERVVGGVGGVGVGGGGGGGGRVVVAEVGGRELRACEMANHQKRRRSSLGSLAGVCVGDEAGQAGARRPGGRQPFPQASENPPGDGGSSWSCESAQDTHSVNGARPAKTTTNTATLASTLTRKQQFRKHTSLASTLASIDLTSSFEKHDKSGPLAFVGGPAAQPLSKSKKTIFDAATATQEVLKHRLTKGRINQTGRVLRRSGSELSLYSTLSAGSGSQDSASLSNNNHNDNDDNNNNNNGQLRTNAASSSAKAKKTQDPSRETKLIIMLQVCLPFILAGFGNMAAGLALNKIANWQAFRNVPIFFVLLPSFVGLKGNIEMTLASRLSTLSNLNLLDSSYQRRHAYVSNLILILSQAIGLSVFATLISILCEFLMGKLETSNGISELIEIASLVVLPSALITAIVLVIISSFVMSLAILLANFIQVNPDNLSTLIAALYGDVSCVMTYGIFAECMYMLRARNALVLPMSILCMAIICYPVLCYMAYKFKETHNIALASMPPMLTSILVSMGSGAVLSLVVGRFSLIALYQPVVNGFGANLIAVQASRVSTWLWCKALRRVSVTHKERLDFSAKNQETIASFAQPTLQMQHGAFKEKLRIKIRVLMLLDKFINTMFWSFCNPSPNSIAARLLLIMLIPAHTAYFLVIWLLSPPNYVTITWQFYFIYISLCLVQVFILLSICEPLMTVLMKHHFDPDIFGISLLMALADLVGTLCLAGAFFLLAAIGDVNAHR